MGGGGGKAPLIAKKNEKETRRDLFIFQDDELGFYRR